MGHEKTVQQVGFRTRLTIFINEIHKMRREGQCIWAVTILKTPGCSSLNKYVLCGVEEKMSAACSTRELSVRCAARHVGSRINRV
jgi:hypothetical protein